MYKVVVTPERRADVVRSILLNEKVKARMTAGQRRALEYYNRSNDMSFEENFKLSVKRFLESQGCDVDSVIDFDEKSEQIEKCETCDYTFYWVNIYYYDSVGNLKLYTYDGHFSDLIKRLTFE